MPYSIKDPTAKGEKYRVVNTETDETVAGGEHETREKALAHMRALYANMPECEMKRGARNSVADMTSIQEMHDLACKLGAVCQHAGEEAEGDKAEGEEGNEPFKNSGELEEHQAKQEEQPGLNLSYVKSLGILIPENEIAKLAVKYVGKDQVKGYTFLWGDPKNSDIEGEYFTKNTDFWDTRLGNSPRPLTWDHNQDNSLKASPIIGQIAEWGDDEVGRWYLAKLDRAHRYRKAVDALIEQRLLGTSADSAPQYVTRVKTGKSTWLKEWAWFASALTECPAEPRMIGTLDYFTKSLGLQLPEMSREIDRATWLKNRRAAQLLKLKNS